MKQAFHMDKLIRFTPAILYNGLIWYLSSKQLTINLHGFDKTAHILEYSGLGFLLAFALNVNKNNFKTNAGNSLGLGLITGISDEFHQYFVPTRSADIFDFAADFIGVSLGILIWLIFINLLSFIKANFKAKSSSQQ